MFGKFKPDFTFGAYSDVTPDFLTGQGIGYLLIDIDNTLVPYEQSEPDERHAEWFAALKAAGIGAALISNNGPERVELFSRTLGVPAFPDCKKPSRRGLRRAISTLGVEKLKGAVLGDQLFTDAYAAKRLGLTAIIVPPIKDKKTLLFKLKRTLEKPIMRDYEREKAKKRHL